MLIWTWSESKSALDEWTSINCSRRDVVMQLPDSPSIPYGDQGKSARMFWLEGGTSPRTSEFFNHNEDTVRC